MHPNRGNRTITVNGNASGGSDDLQNGPARWQVAKTWDIAGGLATIQVRRDSDYIDADAFVSDIPRMGAGTYDDRHYNIKYIGNWSNHIGFAGPHDTTVSYSNTTEDAVTFTFVGNQITYYFTRAGNRGYAAVTIDGVHRDEINQYTVPPPDVLWGQSVAYGGLGAGVHTIHISNMGIRDARSTGFYIDVDRFVVQ
jgi:hypothetical protein